MCRLSPAPESAPAFISRVSGDHFTSVHKGQSVSFLRDSLHKGGVSHPQSYRGHSFRRGAATFASDTGVPGELIQVIGDWVSDAYKQYIEHSLSAKVRVAARIREQILALSSG